jgi:cytochrome c oxidase cbb3-type subunit III
MSRFSSKLSSNTIAALALGVVWLAAVQAPAFAGAHSTNPSGEIQPAATYHNYCSVCHGDKGDGKSRAQNSLVPPPRDFTTPESATQLTRARMIESVTNGRSGTAMVGWKAQLSPKEIEGVVDYVRNTLMPANSSSDSNRGRVVFSKNCSVCHGDKGDGKSRAQNSLNPPPRDFTAPAAMKELSRQRMITSVTYGRADTAMAGFKTQLSAADIEAVVDYIRSGFMASSNGAGISGTQHGKRDPMMAAPASSASPAMPMSAMPAMPPHAKPVMVDMNAIMPKGLKGDSNKGAAFYMGNCATCHGATGDGRGPRAYFINPKPRNFLHPASREQFNRIALFDAISNGKLGTEMPAWSKVLSQQEIADVAEFVFQRFIHQQPSESAGSKQAKAPK